MNDAYPQIAIMGHPNAGKSSVVATLTENDSIEIDQRAGTTVASNYYPVVVDGQTILSFIDTPGFQNPGAILDWFQRQEGGDLVKSFLDEFGTDPLYDHDCALLRPVADGAMIILVLDGSVRIKEKDRTEIELLRLTARPRMAVLNNMSARSVYLDEWRDLLVRSFNAVRLFNAHRASFAERMDLLHTLEMVDQRWQEPIGHAIGALEAEWQSRTLQVVDTIVNLLQSALTFKVSKRVWDNFLHHPDMEKVKRQLNQEFEDGLRQLERDAQQQVRAHYHHHVWDPEPDSILARDIFDAEVMQKLGLSAYKLALAGVAAGAASGVLIDAATLGHSLGLGALLGGAFGGMVGIAGSNMIAKFNIIDTSNRKELVIGPPSNPQFPFVLLDRILLYSARAMNWSHGRKAAQEDTSDPVPDKPLPARGFMEALQGNEQRELAAWFGDIRKGRTSNREESCRQLLIHILDDLSSSRIDQRAYL